MAAANQPSCWGSEWSEWVPLGTPDREIWILIAALSDAFWRALVQSGGLLDALTKDVYEPLSPEEQEIWAELTGPHNHDALQRFLDSRKGPKNDLRQSSTPPLRRSPRAGSGRRKLLLRAERKYKLADATEAPPRSSTRHSIGGATNERDPQETRCRILRDCGGRGARRGISARLRPVDRLPRQNTEANRGGIGGGLQSDPSVRSKRLCSGILWAVPRPVVYGFFSNTCRGSTQAILVQDRGPTTPRDFDRVNAAGR